MLHTQTTSRTRLIAIGVAALMTLAIAVGIPALGGYEASRAAVATNMEKIQAASDVITVIGHRHHRGDAGQPVELAESMDPAAAMPCLK